VQGGISIPFVGGTSCATPTASGIISLLNDLRIQAGKPVLGFLNPFIYQTAPSKVNSFNDATTGADEGW
jgi:tripeptidyl-peptidase-1